jgi:hypothetical protein
MTHTLEDYTTKWKLAKIYAQIDTGELAARIGAPSTFDRRGNIYWFDDFNDSPLKWQVQTHIDGGTGALDTTYPYMGTQCCLLTTHNVADRWVRIRRAFPYPLSNRIGFEWWWQTADLEIEHEAWFEIDDGTNLYTAMYMIDVENKTLKIWTGAGTWTTVATLTEHITRRTYMYNVMKIVVDFDAAEYVRCFFNETEYDISAHSMVGGASADYARIDTWLEVTTTDNTANNLYIDNFIYTFNEP